LLNEAKAFEQRWSIPMPGRIGILVFVCAAAGAAPAENAAREDAGGFDAHVRPVLARHCLRCHAGEEPKGKLGLDVLSSDLANDSARAHWADVIERVEAGEMPPKGRPRPGEEEVRELLDWRRSWRPARRRGASCSDG
jgi:hypothetical protein